MKTNDLKKGMVVQLYNGWFGVMADNMRGNIRMVKVYGDFTEIGSVHAHDIVRYFEGKTEADMPVMDKQQLDTMLALPSIKIEHTDAQKKLREQVRDFGF